MLWFVPVKLVWYLFAVVCLPFACLCYVCHFYPILSLFCHMNNIECDRISWEPMWGKKTWINVYLLKYILNSGLFGITEQIKNRKQKTCLEWVCSWRIIEECKILSSLAALSGTLFSHIMYESKVPKSHVDSIIGSILMSWFKTQECKKCGKPFWPQHIWILIQMFITQVPYLDRRARADSVDIPAGSKKTQHLIRVSTVCK